MLTFRHRMFPEWKLDSAFISAHIEHAMKQDNKLSSHPVEVDCPDANKINQASPRAVSRSIINPLTTRTACRSLTVYLTPRRLLVRRTSLTITSRLKHVPSSATVVLRMLANHVGVEGSPHLKISMSIDLILSP